MKIFVTGSQGFIGSHLCPRLIQLGHQVLQDFRLLTPTRSDVIIHLAAKTDTSLNFNPSLIETNYFLTWEIFQYPARIIFASSCSAGYLTNPYAYSKAYGEYLTQYNSNSVALRFHNVYGSGARRGIVKALMDAKDGDRFVVRGALLLRDYIHVYDVCSEIINCITNGQRGVLDVGTGIATTTISLVNLYMHLSGKTFDLDYAKAWDHEPLRMVASIPCSFVTLEAGLKMIINHEDINYGVIL